MSKYTMGIAIGIPGATFGGSGSGGSKDPKRPWWMFWKRHGDVRP